MRLNGILVSKDLVDGLARGEDFLGILVGDFDVELVLERHGDFDLVEAVEPQIVDKVGVQGQLR